MTGSREDREIFPQHFQRPKVFANRIAASRLSRKKFRADESEGNIHTNEATRWSRGGRRRAT
jgi:hypothetical protein